MLERAVLLLKTILCMFTGGYQGAGPLNVAAAR
jgi:hypothetical protein